MIVAADSHLSHVMYSETQNGRTSSNRLTLFGDPFKEKLPNTGVQLVNRPELELFRAVGFTALHRFHSFYAFNGIV